MPAEQLTAQQARDLSQTSKDLLEAIKALRFYKEITWMSKN